MGPQGFTGEPRAVRELEVVDLREDDLDGEAVDLRAEQAVSRVDMPCRSSLSRESTSESGAHRDAVVMIARLTGRSARRSTASPSRSSSRRWTTSSSLMVYG